MRVLLIPVLLLIFSVAGCGGQPALWPIRQPLKRQTWLLQTHGRSRR